MELNLLMVSIFIFLDSDDYIHPQCLEVAYGLAIENNADLVSFQYEINNLNDANCCEVEPLKKDYKEDVVVTANPLVYAIESGEYSIHYNVWTKLYKKTILKDIEFIKGIHYEDYPYVFILLSKKPKTVITKAKLYKYTINPKSITHSNANPKQIVDYFTGIRSIVSAYDKDSLIAERALLKEKFIPEILRQQLGRCKHADKDVRKEMFINLEAELEYLKNKNMLTYFNKNIIKCFIYTFVYKL